jgi:hypothetical protein
MVRRLSSFERVPVDDRRGLVAAGGSALSTPKAGAKQLPCRNLRGGDDAANQ